MALDYPLRLFVREGERGLSSAVVHGMCRAQFNVLVVMDADLSHPPEKIPELVAVLENENADFVIASRYIPGGSTDENWGTLRCLNSKIATLLARPLTSTRDPMSGFFAIRRDTFLQADVLDPIGYKIGLELMVKCGCKKVQEVPIQFRDRGFGESKLSFRQQLNYLVHLVRLYDYRFEHLSCPVKFCLVGATGLGLDLVMFAALLVFLPLFAARALAIWIAMSWNFFLNRQFTFGTNRRHGVLKQYGLFCASCLGGATISWSISVWLSHQTVFFGDRPLLAAFLGVIAGTGLNYLFSRHITFRLNPAKAGNSTTCRCKMVGINEDNTMVTNLGGLRAFLNSLVKIAGGEEARKQVLLIGLLAAMMLGLRLLAMAFVPLIPEEAYYWMYAKNPALSYFDHPPMVAWVIGVGTAIFGDTEFGVRIVGNVLMIGASLLMYRLGRMWFGTASGVFAAVLLQILPVYFGTGFIATMDAPLLFFWLTCMLGVTVALKEDRPWGWYLGGAGLGLAMLSKYTGVFLVPGALLAVVVYRPWRRHLVTIHPYLGILLAMALFSPVIIWNAQHDWASFRFQFLNRWDADSVSVTSVLEFIGFQVLITTPLVLWGGGRRVLRKFRRLPRGLAPPYLISLAFSLPLLLVMAYKSFYDIHLNWTLPVYLSIFPIVGHWVAATMRLRTDRGRGDVLRKVWALTAVFCIGLNILLSMYVLVLQPRVKWVSAFGPWKQLAQVVEEHEERLENESGEEPLIVADGKYRFRDRPWQCLCGLLSGPRRH